MSTISSSLKSGTAVHSTRVRSMAELLAPLDEIARHSANLVVNHGATFQVGSEAYELPRYLFLGPNAGDAPLRVAIFAAIHGDEPEGAYAAVQFIKLLEANPELVAGYSLSIYPVCNPTGFEDNTHHSRSGKDLNREFWTNSREPEIRLLQAELISRSFHGIISLHTDDQAGGFYGIVRGTTLARHLIEPALQAVENFLPRDQRTLIDGFHARDGVIHGVTKGQLRVPPRIRPQPFELTLQTPGQAPLYVKESTFVLALETILTEYRKFIAYAQNL